MKSRTIEVVKSKRSSDLIESSAVRVWTHLGSEVALMERRGYTVEQRDEYVFDYLSSLEKKTLSEAEDTNIDLLRGVKKMIADKIADYLQIQPGFLRDTITNFMAGFGIDDIRTMMSSGGCTTIVIKLGAGVQGAVVDHFLKTSGMAPTGFMSTVITEAIKSGFVEGGPFVKKVSEVVCNLNISELVPGGNILSSAGSAISSLFGGSSSTPGTAPAQTPGTAPAQ